jgi:toxin ParE1/3/4
MPALNRCSGAECSFVGHLAAANDLESISIIFTINIPSCTAYCALPLRGIRELSRFPLQGRPGREPGTRELILSGLPYVIVFRTRDQVVEILRIYHGSQNWK